MIRLASFRPALFNNNGDQGSIQVIVAHFAAQGIEHEMTDSFETANFVLIGDCAIAVLEQYQAELSDLVPILKMRLVAGLPTLLVGRSYEFLAAQLGIELQHGERESNFVKIESLGHSVLGYHNSTVVAPRLFLNGAFIGTTLFGPLLAKNPSVLQLMLRALGAETDGEFFKETLRLTEQVRAAITS